MTMTFIAAVRHDGLSAPCVFDGPINAIEKVFATLKRLLLRTKEDTWLRIKPHGPIPAK
ncbi:hypothetical protein [Thalassospira povalilytica]|uniref:hypothetical protein n=1 Tax=Thalassospira povalilytica TaxID=732237 RepID=UPI003AA99B3D